jgi:hypothetical protein
MGERVQDEEQSLTPFSSLSPIGGEGRVRGHTETVIARDVTGL